MESEGQAAAFGYFYEDEDEDEDEDDGDYDPDADSEDEEEEAFSRAVEASLAEEVAPAPPASEEESEGGSEVEVVEIPDHGEGDEGGGVGGDDEGRECEASGSRSGEKQCEVQLDPSVSPICSICLEPWVSGGAHRVCCIPCGHIYGRSCLEKWLQRYRKNTGECPQCKKRVKQKDIINLYAPLVVVQNDDLEMEVHSLREKNEILKSENMCLLEEVKKHRNHPVDSGISGRQKMQRLEQALSGAIQRRLYEFIEGNWSPAVQNLSENRLGAQNFRTGGSRQCSFVLQNEFQVNGGRVLGIDASNRILIFSEKTPGVGGEHILNKASMLVANEIDRIQLPPDTGAIRDLCILPNGLALFASLGKKLSLLSMTSNNCVLKYDLPGPAWSCSGDLNSSYHVYAGLQNGMLLTFDMRQTARHLDSVEGLSRQPVHTIHPISHNDRMRKVLTAASLGPCIWDVSGGERPLLIPGLENHGVCISLAYASSSDDIVASFRPRVELPNDEMSSQTSASPSTAVSGMAKMGSHVLIKRIGDTFQNVGFFSGNVSATRMSKSAIITTEGNNPLFAYGDESSHGICLWDMQSFDVCNSLRPHQHPILDLKYARAMGPGFLGCISEDRLQVFTCYWPLMAPREG